MYLNSLLSTNQTIRHFINQNDMKVQIDRPIMLTCPNRLVQIDKVKFFTPVIFGFF
jgi:hypothetical protein